MFKRKAELLGLTVILFILAACTRDCLTLRAYNQLRSREEIAIVRTDVLPSVTVNAIDGKPVPGNLCFFLLEPGLHEFIISYADGYHSYHNVRKYLNVAAGRTYRLRTNTKIRFWPGTDHPIIEFADWTSDPKHHISNIPEEENIIWK